MANIADEEERLKSCLSYQEGDKVYISGTNRVGRVRFLGFVSFAEGLFAGIELANAEGRNNGTVDGRWYFTCKPKHGLFVRAASLVPEADVLGKLHKGEGVSEDERHTHIASGTPIAKSRSHSQYNSPAPRSASKILSSSSARSTPRSKVSVFKGDEQLVINSPAFKDAVNREVSAELRDIKERLRKCEEENSSLWAALDKRVGQNLAESEEAFRVIAELCKKAKADKAA